MIFHAVILNFDHPLVAYAQTCPAEPVILKAKSNGEKVYLHTNGYETGRYENNMQCSWILVGSSDRKRIMLTVHDSSIDDALFSECDDYCSIHDGGTLKSQEVVRWCGEKHPDTVISTTNSLYVYFHSDEAFQGKGINMSFIEFDVPGCPPNWISSSSGYCYILKRPVYGLTWLEAQKQCGLERSNLLTLTSAKEYSFVAALYTKSRTSPWIGYMDYNNEDRFVSVDQNSGAWPEEFVDGHLFNTENKTKNFDCSIPGTIPVPVIVRTTLQHKYIFGTTSTEDLVKMQSGFSEDSYTYYKRRSYSRQECVYIDWSDTTGNILALDDCRNRHEYICKRHQDGTTIPYSPQRELRNSLAKSPISFTLWLFIFLLLLLMLILLYLCYRKCRKQHALSRIGSSDVNQRLVTGIDVQRVAPSVVVPHIGNSEFQKTCNVAVNSDDVNSDARATTTTENADNTVSDGILSRQTTEQNQKSHSVGQSNLERIEPTVLTIEPRFNTCQVTEESLSLPGRSKQNLTFGGRERTMGSITREETLLKIRRGELFERPRVSVLDHTSAISLDEFWNKNEISTADRK